MQVKMREKREKKRLGRRKKGNLCGEGMFEQCQDYQRVAVGLKIQS